MNKKEIYQRVKDSGMIPVFYYDDKETSLNVFRACVNAGLKVIEYTNRGEHALENFKALVKERKNHPDVILAIGSVFNVAQVDGFHEAGADVIVSPIVDVEVGTYCLVHDIAWIPGIGSATEAYQAHLIGAQVIKVFPGAVLGPDFIKSILAPMPWLDLMPTGGVEPTSASLASWYNAGVVTVGMGSQLLDKNDINSGDFEALTAKMKSALALVNDIKNKK